jgi:NADH-quinone oxidoreductase subunit L
MPESSFLIPTCLLLGLPFLAFLLLWLVGRKGNKIAGWCGSAITAIGLYTSISLADPSVTEVLRLNWLVVGDIPFQLTFQFDTLSCIMLVVVHFVALLVQLYSMSYLHGEPNLHRYFAFIQLFLFSMIGIVLGGSLLVMYIFWELVGLSSYLLIGFWYKKSRAVWAAQKAFVLNRIGDAAFLTGILLLFYYIGSTDFGVLRAPDAFLEISPGMLTLIGICLFGGCMGKSAQFPLSGWLPDAMEGPTPVSALIHAATMVAAGIFLMVRISFLLTIDAKLFITIIGTITMLIGAVKASQAWDIKRVLAYSTMSQLGIMVIAIGFGSWHTAMFHLTTHAFFKAGLFLSAGSVIHAVKPSKPVDAFDPQDMRTMGGLRTIRPITFICFAICAAALAGLPFFSGFLSKDAIIAEGFLWAEEFGSIGIIFPILILFSAGLTAYYMVRQVWLIFLGKPRYEHISALHPHESPLQMWLPMAILAVLSIFIWFSWNPIHADGSWFLNLIGKETSAHLSWLPFVALGITGVALYLAYRETTKSNPFSIAANQQQSGLLSLFERFTWTRDYERSLYFIRPFHSMMEISKALELHLIDRLVNLIAKISVILGNILAYFDQYIVDGVVGGFVHLIGLGGKMVRNFQNGKIQSYYLVAAMGVFFLLMWLAWM